LRGEFEDCSHLRWMMDIVRWFGGARKKCCESRDLICIAQPPM